MALEDAIIRAFNIPSEKPLIINSSKAVNFAKNFLLKSAFGTGGLPVLMFGDDYETFEKRENIESINQRLQQDNVLAYLIENLGNVPEPLPSNISKLFQQPSSFYLALSGTRKLPRKVRSYVIIGDRFVYYNRPIFADDKKESELGMGQVGYCNSKFTNSIVYQGLIQLRFNFYTYLEAIKKNLSGK